MTEPLTVTSRVVLPAEHLSWTAARASGSGGQNVNKVSSKVELTLDFERVEALPERVKARLRSLASRLDAEGRLRVTSQLTRDQGRNLADARAKLAEIVAAALEETKPRRPTKPTRGSVRRRLEEKARTSMKKTDRRAKAE